VSARILSLDPEAIDSAVVEEAARLLREGRLVVFPTETVYGIGTNRDRPEAVRRLLEVRGSPEDKRLTLHVSSREEALRHAARPLPVLAQRLMRRFWPGPLTIVLPACGGGTVGLRYPNHRGACEILRSAGVPVVAASANRAGDPPATDAAAAREALPGSVDLILDGGPTKHRNSSTVVRVGEGGTLEVLREGAIPESVVREVCVRALLFICTGNTCRSPMAAALFRGMLAQRLGVPEEELEARGWKVSSAGTAAGAGAPASDHALEVMAGMGADLENHSSQPVTVSMLEDADRVFVMTRSHREVLEEWMPDCAQRIELLDSAGGDIDDPIGGNLEVYRACAERIRACLRGRIGEVAPP